MRIRLFYHAVRSDWNNGNAHFLRGIATELVARDHDVWVYEPADNWSTRNLLADGGAETLKAFAAEYPTLRVREYRDPSELEALVADADLVIAHEWNEPAVLRRLGELRRESDFVLFYHDTHHRLITDRANVTAENLHGYDAVLAYGQVLADAYLNEGLAKRAWTWHEAADTRVFAPRAAERCEGDLVWIGNWGDDEREAELHEFLIEPVRRLGLKARIHGVRYPERALRALASAGIEYAGWLPNFEAPRVFARYRVTVHVPRRPYVEHLRGIPTIRPFEAMACGIPLVCSPWDDAEDLFRPGLDYLIARDSADMTEALRLLLASERRREAMAERGLATIRARHTCAHRVDELLRFHRLARAAAENEAGEGTAGRGSAVAMPVTNP